MKYGKKQIVKLFNEGKGPLSIAVNMGLTHRKVKEYLKQVELMPVEEYKVRGLNEQWIGT